MLVPPAQNLGAHVWRQGYHQIAVWESDRKRLAIFAPYDRKYTFNVMPFGPTNAPLFYTAMMKDTKDEWVNCFFTIDDFKNIRW